MLIVGMSVLMGVKTIISVRVTEVIVVYEGYGSYTGHCVLYSVGYVVQSGQLSR